MLAIAYYSPDGTSIAIGGNDERVKIYDTLTYDEPIQ